MTLEIIVFILAILFGIVWYWRESKSNKMYRLINRITHTKDLRMSAENGKGFVHEQPFLLRLVWITLLFVTTGLLVTLLTPINAFYIQYFASAIVGTLIGTYIASFFLFARDSTKKENLEKMFEKGKDFVEDLTDGDDGDAIKSDSKDTEPKVATEKPKTTTEKSARDRLKDKGMIK